MTSSDPYAAIKAWIVQTAGGFLRNTISSADLTCSVCRTASPGPAGRCGPCQGHFNSAGAALSDRVGFVTYATSGRQSGWVMYGYKRRPLPDPDHFQLVKVLTLAYMRAHNECAAKLAGQPITHWASVPSLPAKQGVHALNGIISGWTNLPEISLAAAASCSSPRALDRTHFVVQTPVSADAHILLVEDTWVGGGHVQSAALALRHVGAAQISTLLVARWLEPNWGSTDQFIRTHLKADFDPEPCPWTAGACP